MNHARTFAAFDPRYSSGSLPELCLRLLEEQKQSWPQLAEGYASLASLKLRELRCDGNTINLQFNPGRIVSTGADVNEQAIRERECFLCVSNLPPPQKGILYRNRLLILCNPAPIFREHFTISHTEHIPQAVEPFIPTFLDLARDLSPRFTIFYNGPRCGASAPDHLHFQASPTGAIPVEADAAEDTRRKLRKTVESVSVFSLERYGRQVLVFESGGKEGLQSALLRTIASLRKVLGSADEPMMNILASFSSSAWRLILFPRGKHRPDVYFKEGEERVLVSPAAVDLGGLVVTPLEGDFNKVNAKMIQAIFDEVSIQREMFEALVSNI